jgi:hypothetical protein
VTRQNGVLTSCGVTLVGCKGSSTPVHGPDSLGARSSVVRATGPLAVDPPESRPSAVALNPVSLGRTLVLFALVIAVAGCGSEHARSTGGTTSVPSPSRVYGDCETARNVAASILGNTYGSATPNNIERVISSGERRAATELQQASQKLENIRQAGGSGSESSAHSFATKLSSLATVLVKYSHQAAAAHGSTPTAVLREFGTVRKAVEATCPPRAS